MRRHAAVAALLLLFAVSAFAQDRATGLDEGQMRLSVFGADLGFLYSESGGSHVQGDVGAALEYHFNSRWATEISVTRERHVGYFLGSRTSEVIWPVDATAQYHFLTRSAWKPFVGAGVRYASSHEPFDSYGVAPQLVAGTYLNITPRVALRFDVRQILNPTPGDDGTKVSVGLGFKF